MDGPGSGSSGLLAEGTIVGMSGGSGDGWAAGADGVPAWGRFGAAGLFLLADGQPSGRPGSHRSGTYEDPTYEDPLLLLQHRAHWTNQGGTWGIPGGARDAGETPEEAALRESEEECGIAAGDIVVLATRLTSGPFGQREVELAAASGSVGLASGWSYTTVIARTLSGFPLRTAANAESLELRWVPVSKVEQLPLLGAFRLSFPALRQAARELTRK